MSNGSHSTSLVLLRLIGALVTVEAVVKPALLAVMAGECGTCQLKPCCVEAARCEKSCEYTLPGPSAGDGVKERTGAVVSSDCDK